MKKSRTAPKKKAAMVATTEGITLTVEKYAPAAVRGAPLAPRGSIVVFLAASGSRGLDKVRKSAKEGKPLKPAIANELDLPERKESYSVALRYGGTLLADAVPVPRDGRVVRVILPYNGGGLVNGGLTLHVDGAEQSVSAVALRNDPPLTRVERSALSLVPADLSFLHLGAAIPSALIGANDEERRRQEQERARQAQEQARQEEAAARAEAQAEAAAERAERRAEQRERQGGSIGYAHLVETSIMTMTPARSAAAMLDLSREMLADIQVEH